MVVLGGWAFSFERSTPVFARHRAPGCCGWRRGVWRSLARPGRREFFIDNLLVRIHFIIVMIRWTGLAPWEGTWMLRLEAGRLAASCAPGPEADEKGVIERFFSADTCSRPNPLYHRDD